MIGLGFFYCTQQAPVAVIVSVGVLTSFFPLSFPLCSDGRFELLGGGSLQIFNLTEEDGGIYSCLADNANDSIEARAELTIQGNTKAACSLTVKYCCV